MKALAVLLVLLGCAACGSDNEVTGPTTAAVPIAGRVIQFFSRDTVGSAAIEFRTTSGSPGIVTISDAAGQYSATLPRGGDYLIYVNGNPAGIAYVGGAGYRGDLIIDNGRCVARYGTITDPAGRPLANATVAIGALQARSAADGFYSIEFGCPSTGTLGSETFAMQVSVAGYSPASRMIGQNMTGVLRLDAALQNKQD
jgi:hypothetical protein